MADNARFHNKLHRKNHHSIQTPGYPDSGTDPIASKEEPFEGDFVVNATVSAQNVWVNSDIYVGQNATITGNLSVYGSDSYFETYATVTSAMSVINHGFGPALTVKQTGPEPIARFLDGDTIGSENALLIADTGQIVINADSPVLDRRVTISGSITASGNTEFQAGSAQSSRSFAANYSTATNWDAASFNYGHATGIGSFSINTNTLAAGSGSFAQGRSTKAVGNYSHAEGDATIAQGDYSHAEGDSAQSQGDYSHAEGHLTTAQGDYSHAEGHLTTAQGLHSHAEGYSTIAQGDYSHAEGHSTIVEGNYSHAEGLNTRALASRSHAEGEGTSSMGFASHTEGYYTSAFNDYAHAGGHKSMAYGEGADAIGSSTVAKGNYSSTRGISTSAVGYYSHAEGQLTVALDTSSHTEGYATSAVSEYAHAEGYMTTASGIGSHSEGYMSVASGSYSHAEGYMTTTSGSYAHAEGVLTSALGWGSHAEGQETIAYGSYSHAEGNQTVALSGAHAEGVQTVASAMGSHTEGFCVTASAIGSHAQGAYTLAAGIASFAAGTNSYAIGNYSSTNGNYCLAFGEASHATGHSTFAYANASYTYGVETSAFGLASVAGGVFTIAAGPASQTVGAYNITTETASGAFVTGRDSIAAGLLSISHGSYAMTPYDLSYCFAGDLTRTTPISTTRTEQYLISARNGVFIPGRASIGVESLDNTLTVAGAASAHMLIAYYTDSNQVTANNIYGYCNETIFTDGVNLSGNGDMTLTMNYTNGIFVSSAPIHFALQNSAANALIFARDSKANLYRWEDETLRTDGSLFVAGNLSAVGDFTYLDTIVSVTSALSVVNVGTGPALTVLQYGPQPIARFIDADALTDQEKYALFIENDGNIGIGTSRVYDKLNIRGNTNMFRLTAASSNFYTLTTFGLSAIARDPDYHLFRGRIGVNTDLTPITSYALHVKSGNMRIDGVDYSKVPGITGLNTDGSSLLDLRSAGLSANYSLSLAEYNAGHFMKLFGGSSADKKASITIKEGSPLLFGTFSSFYGQNYKEHMRVGGNGNVGIGLNHPYVPNQYNIEPTAKLTVVGAISGNNWLSAGNIAIQQADIRTFSNTVTATGDFLVLNINGINRGIRLWDIPNS